MMSTLNNDRMNAYQMMIELSSIIDNPPDSETSKDECFKQVQLHEYIFYISK